MGVKADWGAEATQTSALPPSFDPLSAASSCTTMQPASADKPLDLSSSTAELSDWLQELIRREGNLFDCGTTCPLKDMPDCHCSVCPVSQAAREEGTPEQMRQAGLCRIGIEEERVTMMLLTQRHHHGRERV